MSKLTVKNFGPLKDIDIELNNINLFVGENGSGKSVLAKLITIILDLYSISNVDVNGFMKKLEEYNINFVTDDTAIKYYNKEVILFELKNGNISKNDLLKLQEIHKEILLNKYDIDTERDKINQRLEEINNFKQNGLSSEELKKIENIELEINNDLTRWNKLSERILNTEDRLLKLTSQYIPAERNLISIFNKYVTTFITADIPLPKFLLNFSSQYIRAREEIKELGFLNVKYKFKNEQECIYYNDNDYLLLEQSSSGIQSVLPLYLTVKYFSSKHESIIIEEPEQNLFPKAQSETIKYIVEQIADENRLFMMTHSPYILSTLNNLIYAYIVAELGEEEKKKVKEIINEKQWINPKSFSAYYIEDGKARSIVSDIGLISDNVIDDISEEMGEEFDELLEIYRVSKNG